MTIRTLLLALTLFLNAGSPASAAAEAADPRQEILEAALPAWSIPGVSATVIGPDGSIWTGVAGTRGAGKPVEPATLFDIGSITKTFTAALVLELVERGDLALDDPLSLYVPDFPRASEIRIRHLLNHTSGVRDTFENPEYLTRVLGDLDRSWTPEDSFALLGEPRSAPGDAFHYANPNYLLLGLVVEAVSGKSLEAAMGELLIRPLALGETIFRTAEPQRDGHAAHPFIDVDSDGVQDDLGSEPLTAFVTSGWSAGAMASTSTSLARWGRAYLEGQLVEGDLRQEMMTTVERPNGGYGLGISFRQHRGQTLAGHAGNGAGFSASLWHDAEKGVTVAVLTNRHLFQANQLADLLRDASLGEEVELPRPAPEPKNEAKEKGTGLAPDFFKAAQPHLEKRDFAAALDPLTRAAEIAPDNALYQRTLGVTALAACEGAPPFDAMRFSQIARRALTAATELDPSDVEAKMGLMRFYLYVPPIAGGSAEKAHALASEIAALDEEMGRRAAGEIAAAISRVP